MEIPPADTPVACDMSTASDSPAERLAEYHRLFRRALAGREKTPSGIRFRFRAGDGIAQWVRDLAAREHACCAFMAFEVTAVAGEVHLDVAVSDSDAARAMLGQFYDLPETMGESPAALAGRYRELGLAFVNGDLAP
jgi:hypothetical protein